MKYIIYNLKWSKEGLGEQPYQAVADAGVELEGGIIVNLTDILDKRKYFGYLHGTDDQCLKAIENCKDYKMKEISEKEALDFFELLIPINTEIEDIITKTKKYTNKPTVNINGKIKQNYKDKIIL